MFSSQILKNGRGWDGKGKVKNNTMKKVVIFICVLEFYYKLQGKERKLPKLQIYPQNINFSSHEILSGHNSTRGVIWSHKKFHKEVTQTDVAECDWFNERERRETHQWHTVTSICGTFLWKFLCDHITPHSTKWGISKILFTWNADHFFTWNTIQPRVWYYQVDIDWYGRTN